MIFTTTERLIIRAFKDKDASALFDYLASPRTPCFQDEKLNSLEDAIKEVDRRARDNGQFAVCLKETDDLASQKLCARLHMRQEGCFKEFVSFMQGDGVEKYDDTFIFALLKKEWMSLLSGHCKSAPR